jgi:flagellar motor switch protein FliN/FliY
MSTLTSSAFITAWVAELASAIEAVAGSPVAAAPGVAAVEHGWTVPLTLSGALRSHVRLVLDQTGVTALLRVVLGADADTSEASARDLLTELVNQSISATCLKPAFTRVVATPGPIVAAALQGDESPLCTLALDQLSLAIVAATIDAAPTLTADSGTAARESAVAPARRAAAVAAPANLDVVLDIELPLSVRFGSTMMSIRSLSQIGPGSIVDMGRSPDDPVEILVCGRPIARAEVVIVGGNYGVRITDLTSAAERLRAMEGQL